VGGGLASCREWRRGASKTVPKWNMSRRKRRVYSSTARVDRGDFEAKNILRGRVPRRGYSTRVHHWLSLTPCLAPVAPCKQQASCQTLHLAGNPITYPSLDERPWGVRHTRLERAVRSNLRLQRAWYAVFVRFDSKRFVNSFFNRSGNSLRWKGLKG
jgi:hypothetical protein